MTSRAIPSDPSAGGLWLPVALIAACTGIEVILQLAGVLGLSPRLRTVFYEYGGFWVGLLNHWRPNYALQPYSMFLTYGFLHAGVIHLGVNMITLWSLARAVLARVGTRGFAQLYFGTMIGGGAGYALLADGPAVVVGASGALFGLAGGLLTWAGLDRLAEGESLRPVLGAVAMLGALNGVLWWVLSGQLAWQTHLGGLVTGAALAPLIDHSARRV